MKLSAFKIISPHVSVPMFSYIFGVLSGQWTWSFFTLHIWFLIFSPPSCIKLKVGTHFYWTLFNIPVINYNPMLYASITILRIGFMACISLWSLLSSKTHNKTDAEKSNPERTQVYIRDPRANELSLQKCKEPNHHFWHFNPNFFENKLGCKKKCQRS